MTGLAKPRSSLPSICLALSLGLAPLGPVHAAPPGDPPEFTTEAPLRLVDTEAETSEPAPEPEPAPVELVDYTHAPTPSLELDSNPGPQLRRVDSERPRSGTAVMAFGGLTLAASSALAMGALAGPGWLGIERDDALIVGAMTLPTALLGAGLLAGGAKANKRYRRWTERNDMHPPETGNALIVIGGSLTLGFTGLAAYGARWAATKPTHERGDWAPMIVSGGLASLSAIMLAGGAMSRKKFDAWERNGYLAPGALAVKGGAGVSISGRF